MTKLAPNTAPSGKEIATLAGGCFWCLEAVYDQLKGVESVESGYTGGQVTDPSYRQVCDGDTGHAEVVRITYDPRVVGFGDLLDVFFVIHDPTQLNRQGNDVGTQYRSAVFYHSPEQKRIAQEKIAELARQGVYDDRIVTEIAEAGPFYVAEDYHQEYFANNPYQGYCTAVVAPKVAKFRKQFIDKLKR
jgi:peptide-methionine (S)-S-oxide reductase